MNTYKEGYRAGWTSYLSDYKVENHALEQLQIRVQHLAAKAEHAISPQQQCDYWLGYHHGRTAAKTCLTKEIHR
jgi:hypothetical protein